MFKRLLNWQVLLGLILIASSALVYYIHYLIFRDAHHIFLYLIGDIAFVFIEVLLVTLVLHNLLAYREKKSLMKKLNMVIGAFFSEVGIELIKIISGFDSDVSNVSGRLMVTQSWTDAKFKEIRKFIVSYAPAIDHRRLDARLLKDFLTGKRNFLLALLENPNLLEHESFTNLLWAVFHLTEELANRKDVAKLTDPDLQHLAGDVKRVYGFIILEWLLYMNHLKDDYPYLFSLAMRTNPFDVTASVELG